MDKQAIYDLIKMNPDVRAREVLTEYVDNTEFRLVEHKTRGGYVRFLLSSKDVI